MAKQNNNVPNNGAARQIPIDPKSTHSRLLPKDTSKSKKLFWTFSFKFFRQIDLFGLKNVDPNWFSGVLDRLRDTSKMEYNGMTEVLEDGYRYHIISWDAKNCPLKRSDFNWLDTVYLENEIEYPFCQFHISKAKGRIIGFWDENNIFQILLLDPLHNMQPSSKVEYELRDSFPAMSEIDSLRHDLNKILKKPCTHENCEIEAQLKLLPSGINDTNIVVAYLEDSFYEEYKKILTTKSLSEILEAGIVSLL